MPLKKLAFYVLEMHDSAHRWTPSVINIRNQDQADAVRAAQRRLVHNHRTPLIGRDYDRWSLHYCEHPLWRNKLIATGTLQEAQRATQGDYRDPPGTRRSGPRGTVPRPAPDGDALRRFRDARKG